LSRWTYHSEARSMTAPMRLGQRRLSSRWNRRGASRRAASRSFNAPQSKPGGRTVCPSSPAASSDGACPRRRAIARHNSTTTALSSRVRSCTASTTTRSKSANPGGSSSSRSRATVATAAARSGKMPAKASGSMCPATFKRPVVEGRNGTQPRADQRAGVIDDRAEDGSDIQAPADAQAGPAQPEQAIPQLLDLSLQVVGAFSRRPPARTRPRHPARCRHMATDKRPGK